MKSEIALNIKYFRLECYVRYVVTQLIETNYYYKYYCSSVQIRQAQLEQYHSLTKT